MEIIYRFRQIRIDKAIYRRLKTFCAANDKKIGIFFDEILQWFLETLKQNETIVFYASRHEDYLMTIRISVAIADRITAVAIKEKISDARVIYTALKLYLEVFAI